MAVPRPVQVPAAGPGPRYRAASDRYRCRPDAVPVRSPYRSWPGSRGPVRTAVGGPATGPGTGPGTAVRDRSRRQDRSRTAVRRVPSRRVPCDGTPALTGSRTDRGRHGQCLTGVRGADTRGPATRRSTRSAWPRRYRRDGLRLEPILAGHRVYGVLASDCSPWGGPRRAIPIDGFRHRCSCSVPTRSVADRSRLRMSGGPANPGRAPARRARGPWAVGVRPAVPGRSWTGPGGQDRGPGPVRDRGTGPVLARSPSGTARRAVHRGSGPRDRTAYRYRSWRGTAVGDRQDRGPDRGTGRPVPVSGRPCAAPPARDAGPVAGRVRGRRRRRPGGACRPPGASHPADRADRARWDGAATGTHGRPPTAALGGLVG